MRPPPKRTNRKRNSGTLAHSGGKWYTMLRVGSHLLRLSIDVEKREDALERLNKMAIGCNLPPPQRLEVVIREYLKRKTTPLEEDADAAGREGDLRRYEAVIGALIDINGDIPFKEVWERYSAKVAASGGAPAKEEEALWRDFYEWIFGKEGTAQSAPEAGTHPKFETINCVTAYIVREYVRKSREEGIDEATIMERVAFLRRIWEALGVNPNPWAKIPGAPIASIHHQPFTPEEVELVASCSEGDDELKKFIMLMGYTGLGLADAAKLKWEDISFSGREISFSPRTRHYGRTHATTLPLLEPLVKALGEPGTGLIVPKIAGLSRAEHLSLVNKIITTSGLRFMPTKSDEILSLRRSVRSIRLAFYVALAKSGMAKEKIREIFTAVSPDLQPEWSLLWREGGAAALAAADSKAAITPGARPEKRKG